MAISIEQLLISNSVSRAGPGNAGVTAFDGLPFMDPSARRAEYEVIFTCSIEMAISIEQILYDGSFQPSTVLDRNGHFY